MRAYQTPELELTYFQRCDVIVTSNGNDDGGADDWGSVGDTDF